MRNLILLFSFYIPFIGFSQLVEDFSDGDFTNNPTWTGTDGDFIVNASQQLQLDADIAGTSYLSTQHLLTDLKDVEWNFYLKQSFAGSGSNYTKIFLLSDSDDLTATQNGYYLLFGEAGSNDAIKLFKIDSGVEALIFTGTLGAVANSFAVAVRLTYSNNDTWNLYTDYTASNNFALEVSKEDATVSLQPYFGILCRYTASNSKKIYLDDIYIGAEITDEIAPLIASVTVVDPQSVEVTFNEMIDAAIEQQAIATNPTLTLNSIELLPNATSVLVKFDTPFANGVLYQATIPEVKDLAGNDTILTFSFQYLVAEVPAYGDVIINEVLADPTPAVGLPEYDYVELYNRSEKYFNLENWKIGNNTTFATITGETWLLPNEYIVLSSPAGANLLTNAKAVTSFPNYKNAADDVILHDDAGNEIDQISYTINWYKDNEKKDGGYSLERSNPTLNCSGEANWRASENPNGGTPGLVNSIHDDTPDNTAPTIDTVLVLNSTSLLVKLSEGIDTTQLGAISATINGNNVIAIQLFNGSVQQLLVIIPELIANATNTLTLNQLKDCQGNSGNDTKDFEFMVAENPIAGDVIINEVMVNPNSVAGLPEFEYVEVYNRSAKYFNLKDWKIGNDKTFGKINTEVWLAPNTYLVLASNSSYSFFPNATSVTSFPSYKNNADDVILMDTSETVIDRISYTTEWYQDSEKKNGGYSLERIHPFLNCSDQTNWRASEDANGGTPGFINSINDDSPDTTAPVIISAKAVSDFTIVVQFSKAITSISTISLSPFVTIWTSELDIDDLSVLTITTADALQTSIPYTLTLENLADCEDNTNPQASTIFYLAEEAAKNDIIFNELLFNPLTGGADFIELKNISDKVINLKDLHLTNAKTGTSNNKTILQDYNLRPHEIVVLTADTLFLKQNYPFTGNGNYIEMAVPAMPNDGSTIVLFRDSSFTIDSLTFTDKWHYQLLDDKKGKSLERISDKALSTEASSWHTAAESHGFATPGLENSQNTDYLYNGTLALSSETISPDNDGFEDYLVLTYEMDDLGYVGSIKIYDDRGREVRNLVQTELLGVRGEFIWDGMDDKHLKANVGPHVILFEGYHTMTGKTFKLKKVVVVAAGR